MKTKNTFVFALFAGVLAFVSCKTIPTNKSDISTKYYHGTVKTSSVDGTMPYGPPQYSKVKRIINTKENVIQEIVTNDGKTFDTSMKATVEDKNKYQTTEKDGSFFGFILFSDDTHNKWSYDITMSDSSGRIIGAGFIDNEGIKTEKYFTDMQGNKMVKIAEDLKEINFDAFQKLTD